MSFRFIVVPALIAAVVLIAPVRAQEKAETVKAFRCTFPLISVGTWNKNGSPEAVLKPSTLILRFDSVNVDEGTAELKSGTVGSGITVQSAGGNIHFVQAFRSGALYVTTIFGKEISPGKLRAVHSRHEYFNVPLDGATSSPEQYYSECDVAGK